MTMGHVNLEFDPVLLSASRRFSARSCGVDYAPRATRQYPNVSLYDYTSENICCAFTYLTAMTREQLLLAPFGPPMLTPRVFRGGTCGQIIIISSNII